MKGYFQKVSEYKMFKCMETALIEYLGKNPVYLTKQKENTLIILNGNNTIQSEIDLRKTSGWKFNHPFGITFYFEGKEMLLCFKKVKEGVDFFGVRGHGSDKLNMRVPT